MMMAAGARARPARCPWYHLPPTATVAVTVIEPHVLVQVRSDGKINHDEFNPQQLEDSSEPESHRLH